MKKICLLAVLVAVAACDKTEAPNPTPKESTPPAASSVAATKEAPKDVPATTSNADALAAYKLGSDMIDNARGDEAREQFKKARTLDPKFFSAIAMEGATTPGAEGDKMIADAIAQGSSLPEAEQVNMKLAQAFHGNDPVKAVELAKKVTELAPKSWHAQFVYGRALQSAGKFAEWEAADKKAMELDPTAAVPYNDLAYAELQQGKTDDAITHLRKYASLLPKEANPQDSLGEALLMAGKYDDAEAAFKKATEINSKFTEAWSGLGYVRLYKGDWAGAYEAFGKHKDAATILADKESVYRDVAWAQLAQGKVADSMKTFDALDAEAAKAKDGEIAIRASIYRAGAILESGKPADAIKLTGTIMEKIEKSEAPDSKKSRWRVYARSWECIANARLAKAPEADKARAAVEELVGKSDDGELKGLVALTKGEAAIAKNDAKAAVEAFKGCQPIDDYCAWERMKAQDKSGDKDGAKATRETIQKAHRRDLFSFYAWSKVAPAAPAK